MANILLIEPFFGGSHAAWAKGYQQFSSHKISILSLSGHHWKWRMHGGAVTLAKMFLNNAYKPDLILGSDMLDLSTFLALTRSSTTGIPSVLYFHENQLSYPWSPADEDPGQGRDLHYGFINYVSALSADAIAFNSHFHKTSFLQSLPAFLSRFPDHQEPETILDIEAKSRVLPLGLDLTGLDLAEWQKTPSEAPLLLWNHRWEYDKNPETFFQILYHLHDEGLNFQLAILGEHFIKQPSIFEEARSKLKEHIVHWGFVSDKASYAHWLWQADILPVTARHDFFGISVIEAMYCKCHPLLPDRLAYPEHFPEEVREKYFYQDEDQLLDRLRIFIRQCPQDKNTQVRTYVQRYDWANMAPVYDAYFDELING